MYLIVICWLLIGILNAVMFSMLVLPEMDRKDFENVFCWFAFCVVITLFGAMTTVFTFVYIISKIKDYKKGL